MRRTIKTYNRHPPDAGKQKHWIRGDYYGGKKILAHKIFGSEIAALKKLPAGYSVILSAPANGLTITHVMNFALDKY
mgnify:CR=1 FL=1